MSERRTLLPLVRFQGLQIRPEAGGSSVPITVQMRFSISVPEVPRFQAIVGFFELNLDPWPPGEAVEGTMMLVSPESWEFLSPHLTKGAEFKLHADRVIASCVVLEILE